MKAKFVEVFFEEVDCWKCNAQYSVYFIGDFYDEKGNKIDNGNMLNFYHPRIIEKVEQYIASNSNKGIAIGPIKERYSGTEHRSYPSFGCPKCDAIFGDFYYRDSFLEAINVKNPDNTILIDISDIDQ